MSFGSICDIIFSIAVLIYVLVSYKHIQLLKEQNKQLAELLSRTNDSAQILRMSQAAKLFRNRNKHSEEERRRATEDGNQEGDSGSDQKE